MKTEQVWPNFGWTVSVLLRNYTWWIVLDAEESTIPALLKYIFWTLPIKIQRSHLGPLDPGFPLSTTDPINLIGLWLLPRSMHLQTFSITSSMAVFGRSLERHLSIWSIPCQAWFQALLILSGHCYWQGGSDWHACQHFLCSADTSFSE